MFPLKNIWPKSFPNNNVYPYRKNDIFAIKKKTKLRLVIWILVIKHVIIVLSETDNVSGKNVHSLLRHKTYKKAINLLKFYIIQTRMYIILVATSKTGVYLSRY